VPFNVVDETIRFVDAPGEPWTVQAEARVPGVLDDARMRDAVAAALACHPMARARQAPWRLWHRGFTWEIVSELDLDPLRVVSVDDDRLVADVRSRLYGCPVALTAAPPLRVALVHRRGGDTLMLAVNHTAIDGLGSLRLLTSIARAYAGVPDPVPDVDPLAVRALAAPLDAARVAGRARDVLALLDELRRPKARIAADGGTDAPGFGFHHARLGADETAALAAARRAGATMNDLLLVALHATIAEWNAAHGAPCERIGVMMPVSLRLPARRGELVGNFSSFATIATTAAERAGPATMLAAVVVQTRRVKAGGSAAALVDVLTVTPPVALPLAMKIATWGLLPFVLDRGLDTAVLSNLGRLEAPLSFGASAGDAAEVWFSPPARMPVGLALGAVTAAGRLHLAFRYRHPLFGPAAAAHFAECYVDMLRRLARKAG
jgi:NRPS condensation-like uncharacterized protein